MSPDRPPARTLRCVVADDHPAIVEAVCRMVERQPGMEVVGRACDGRGAMRLIEARRPDVAVLDIGMLHPGGIEIARALTRAQVPTRAILYTGLADRAHLLEAIDAGASGFVVKDAPLDELARVIEIVGAGGTYIDPELSKTLASTEATERLPALTRREREVLRLLADGMRNDQIAHRLSISPLTVRTHVKNAMVKLEADTRTQAVARALRDELIS